MSSYLIYGAVTSDAGKEQAAPFAKQLGLTFVNALIKHVSTMRCVRVWHTTRQARLKRVTLPGGLPGYPADDVLKRYASPQWDALLPFPASWELRFNDI
jgi:hypothetical protein